MPFLAITKGGYKYFFMIIPYFKSDHSIGRSILTIWEPEDIKDNAPVSIFSIAKKHELKDILLIENSFSSFVQFYKQCKELKIKGIFGCEFVLANNATQKDPDSLKTESKVYVLMKNSDGYKDLCKLYSAIHANKDNFYYIARGDWDILQKYWTDNLSLIIPFYDGFIHRNLLEYGHHSIPNFGGAPPTFFIENHDLPFDKIIEDATMDYCKKNDYSYINAHKCLYYRNSDYKPYITYRAINERTTFNRPELRYNSSDKFSFENYLSKNA